MAADFQSIITFYLNSICTFLLTPPINYFTGALLSLFVIKAFKKLIA